MKILKKSIIIALALLTATAGLNAAFAASRQITATLDDGIKIIYNGNEQVLKDAKGNRVYPIISDGTTYVPIRAITQIFGESVAWDGETRSVILGSGESSPANGDVYKIGDKTPFTFNGYSYDLTGVNNKALGKVTVDSVVVESAQRNDKEETVLKLKITGKIEESTMWMPTIYVNLLFCDAYGAKIGESTVSIDADKSGKTVSGTVTVTAKKKTVLVEIDTADTQHQITY
jgi:hypothetical protein